MTPELKLSLKILQFDSVDLASFLHSEIEENPLLSFVEEAGLSPSDGKARRTEAEIDPALNNSVFTNDSVSENAGRPSPAASSYHEASGAAFDAGGAAFGGNIRKELTLADHIHDQLSFLVLDAKGHMIANFLSECLDENGYLKADLNDAARQLGCSPAEAEDILEKLQDLDPSGVFARDLKECLTIQLRERGAFDKAAGAVLNNLDLLAKHDLAALKKQAGCSEARLAAIIREIQTLDPKPGARFASGDPLQTIVPDVYVTLSKKGAPEVELNAETLPKVLVDETYSSAWNSKKLNGKDGEFLKSCKTRAGWLKRALDQRATTILKVSEALAKKQREFFAKGVQHMKPLTYKDLAEATDLHESTISRVVANKYLACPRGVYRMKYFFSAALGGGGDGEASSAEAARERIKKLIATENPSKPLSDAKIAGMLKAQGTVISRRTVMKYREGMNIPSSFDRKRAGS